MQRAVKTVIIGSGYASLSAACYLANLGYQVQVLEKNADVGGRARQLIHQGFKFDMGPTFYWMPDVFESFFSDFNRSLKDYYRLKKLNPAYQVYFGSNNVIAIGDNLENILDTFEKLEKGSGSRVKEFIRQASDNYHLAMRDLVYRPGESFLEIINSKTLRKLNLFVTSIQSQVSKCVRRYELRKILEFPVLFLGATPGNTPAFYNFMNYADFGLGTWHPDGGMYAVTKGIFRLAKELGVQFKTHSEVTGFEWRKNSICSVNTTSDTFDCDIVLSGADYVHTESLLPEEKRQYNQIYWERKVFAPSALLFYIGFDKKLDNVAHHTLFFDTDFDIHASAIYQKKSWPDDPLFYGSFPSITDHDAAPTGMEAGIFLIPIAPGLHDTPAIREEYYNKIIDRLERTTKQSIRDHILFHHTYCVNDFVSDYNSFKGNAYGLANTLWQTHFLRPKMHSKKVHNLFFCGQLTVPGPGLPPSIISGKVVADLINKYYPTNH